MITMMNINKYRDSLKKGHERRCRVLIDPTSCNHMIVHATIEEVYPNLCVISYPVKVLCFDGVVREIRRRDTVTIKEMFLEDLCYTWRK